jgi:hypothetical protein
MTNTPHIVKPETQVNTTDRGTQFQSEITALHDGGYVVVWTDISLTYNSLGEAIVGQRYDAAGNKVGGDPAHGGEVNLSLFTTGDQSAPAVTTLALEFICHPSRNSEPIAIRPCACLRETWPLEPPYRGRSARSTR